MTERKEGWWMPAQSRKFHYFVEGRALCHGWIFPNYDDISPDTGNEKKGPDDCAACFKKLVKLRASRASDTKWIPDYKCPKCGTEWDLNESEDEDEDECPDCGTSVSKHRKRSEP